MGTQRYLWCRRDGKAMIYYSELEEDDFRKKKKNMGNRILF